MVLVLMLHGGCVSGCWFVEPQCSQVYVRDPEPNLSKGHGVGFQSAFVMTHPPRDFARLRAAAVRICGHMPSLAGVDDNAQWLVYRESWSMSRDEHIETYGKHQTLDSHQDDLILQLDVNRYACGSVARWTYYKDGYGNYDPAHPDESLKFRLPSSAEDKPDAGEQCSGYPELPWSANDGGSN